MSQITDAMVEAACRAFCVSKGQDPDADGGDRWRDLADDMRAALAALPRPTADRNVMAKIIEPNHVGHKYGNPERIAWAFDRADAILALDKASHTPTPASSREREER